MAKLLGLNKNRKLSAAELAIFVKKRNKLVNKFWGDQNVPAMSAQIPFSDAVAFITGAFSKQLPSTGSLTFSFLYRANKRNMVDIFGFSYLYCMKLTRIGIAQLWPVLSLEIRR